MLLIYSLTVPLTQDLTIIIEFIEIKYFPAVHMGSTRVGAGYGFEIAFQWRCF